VYLGLVHYGESLKIVDIYFRIKIFPKLCGFSGVIIDREWFINKNGLTKSHNEKMKLGVREKKWKRGKKKGGNLH